MRSKALFDVVAVPARVGVGVVFVFHGWQKIQVGVTATGKSFHSMGVPAPTAAAVYSTFVELLGGVMLILGLGLPVAGLLLFLDMAGAFAFVNGGNGLFVAERGADVAHQGFELVLVLGLASLLFAVGGGGEVTLDRWLLARRAARREEESYDEYDEGGLVYPELHRDSDSSDTLQTPAPAPRRRIGRSAKSLPAAASTETATQTIEPEPTVTTAAAKPASGGKRKPAAKPDEPAAKPDEPAAEADEADKPRLVSEIIDDTSGDVLVASRKWSRRKKTSEDA